MSVNVYLDERFREHPGIKTVEGVTKIRSEFCDHAISLDRGRYFFIWTLDSDIPSDLKEFVAEISCHEFIPNMAHREAGIYRHKSVSWCELLPTQQGNASNPREMYWLQIKASELADIREIIQLIKLGRIRPEPEESYESPQSGKSRKQLEDELTYWEQHFGEADAELSQARSSVDNLRAELHDSRSKVEALKIVLAQTVDNLQKASRKKQLELEAEIMRLRGLKDKIEQLAAELTDQATNRWPFCTKREIARKITVTIESSKSLSDQDLFGKAE